MPSQLSAEKCVACRRDSPPVTEAEAADLERQVPKWELENVDGVPKLRRFFQFSDFAQAMMFTNAVASIAEQAGHHPLIATEWGRVEVAWWTHKIRGLHRNDFIMAAKTDRLFKPD